MTREEAKQNNLDRSNLFRDLDWELQDLLTDISNQRIDEIYDDFKQRMCKRCEHRTMTEGGYYCGLPEHNVYVDKDFGCNKWEERK